MDGLMGILAFAGVAIVLVQYVVDGLKEMLPDTWVAGKERVWALGLSVMACFLPKVITSVAMPEAVQALSAAECIILGVLISRGAAAWFGLLEKIGAASRDPGAVKSRLYPADAIARAADAVLPGKQP